MWINVTENIRINSEEIEFRSLYSSGPGGQHVNKNMTAVQLRFNILQCNTLPYEVQQRLIKIAGNRVNSDFDLVITARRHRSQERNKKEVMERLCEFIRKASEKRKPRLKRKRSHAENQNRLENKRRQSEKKRLRKGIKIHED